MRFFERVGGEREMDETFPQMIILFFVCFITIFGWMATYIGLKAILFYMRDKKYEPPSKTELKKWCRYAIKDELGLRKDGAD